MDEYLEISDEVKAALDEGRAVVALETTIISHGFAWPDNLDCGRTCERIIREEGAVPAAVGLVNGKIKVGLRDDELIVFAERADMPKASRRDVSALLARGSSAAATVALTMLAAKAAGIRFFATGGIGGVHRGAPNSFDISADLEELAMTNVAVICAGAKAILDIPLTLEYLETAGVPVIGFGTNDFPAFYTRASGCAVDYRVDSAEEAAAIVKAHQSLGLRGGILIAVPIPEEDSLDAAFINGKISSALAEAEAEGIRGKAVTPFLLSRLKETTAGKSVAANKALVYNNCRTAARIASLY